MKVLIVFSLVIAAAMASYGPGGHGGGGYEGGGYEGGGYEDGGYEGHRGGGHGGHGGMHGRGRINVYQNFILPEEEKHILHNYHIQCQTQSKCGLEYIRSPHQYEDYEPLGKYMFCICQKYGFMYPDGRFNYDMLSRKLGLVCTDEDPEVYIDGCAVASVNRYSTAVQLMNCLDNYGFHYLDKCVY